MIAGKVLNRKLADEEFFRIRNEEVLPQWETGEAIRDLEECIAAARELSEGKNHALKFLEAKRNGTFVLVPQFGRALTEYMIEGIGCVESETGLAPAGAWNLYSDSYTRKNEYRKAAAGIERSRREGMSMLNGWPIVNFGVEEARRITRASRLPLHFVTCDEDARLASELALAAGWTANSILSLQECISHSKTMPLENQIRLMQYNARLAAIYEEAGVPQCPWNSSHLTGYDSAGYHSFAHVASAVLAAEQGVKCQFLSHGLNMNLVQDIAMIRVSERLCYEYCARLGYQGVEFVAGVFPFLGAWPPRDDEANAMIAWNATISVLGGFPGVVLKCQDEAFATPTKEGMAKSVRLARHMLTIMGTQRMPESEALHLEEEMIELEVRTLLEKCLEIGEGDMALGMCKGVAAGWIDTMVTPWKYNAGKVLLVRDAENAVRYLETGDVPLPAQVKEYHRAKVAERETKSGRKADLDMVIGDIQSFSTLA
jgi:methylaspartate mutase epsilon subunit